MQKNIELRLKDWDNHEGVYGIGGKLLPLLLMLFVASLLLKRKSLLDLSKIGTNHP